MNNSLLYSFEHYLQLCSLKFFSTYFFFETRLVCTKFLYLINPKQVILNKIYENRYRECSNEKYELLFINVI